MIASYHTVRLQDLTLIKFHVDLRPVLKNLTTKKGVAKNWSDYIKKQNINYDVSDTPINLHAVVVSADVL